MEKKMVQDKLHPLMRPAGDAGKVFQRKLDLESDVERLKAVVASMQRKLDAGSHAVTVEDLAARQRELLQAQDALANANDEFAALAV
ncbi:hypothetical protein [Burkholderia sp. L27(2015)]|uniref:hypothetical protein n=1 Tax=Burkholderia sp. L27(2015) TaxID=1641858 RepID=UPI00131EB6FD|nr:hypothetical protein [Burkholderia sp. L27(2015)]